MIVFYFFFSENTSNKVKKNMKWLSNKLFVSFFFDFVIFVTYATLPTQRVVVYGVVINTHL